MQESPVFLPIAISVTMSAKPKVTARIIYTRRKMPPPYFAARYGKRQRLPKPTAEPAAASTKPMRPVKLLLSFDIKSLTEMFILFELLVLKHILIFISTFMLNICNISL